MKQETFTRPLSDMSNLLLIQPFSFLDGSGISPELLGWLERELEKVVGLNGRLYSRLIASAMKLKGKSLEDEVEIGGVGGRREELLRKNMLLDLWKGKEESEEFFSYKKIIEEFLDKYYKNKANEPTLGKDKASEPRRSSERYEEAFPSLSLTCDSFVERGRMAENSWAQIVGHNKDDLLTCCLTAKRSQPRQGAMASVVNGFRSKRYRKKRKNKTMFSKFDYYFVPPKLISNIKMGQTLPDLLSDHQDDLLEDNYDIRFIEAIKRAHEVGVRVDQTPPNPFPFQLFNVMPSSESAPFNKSLEKIWNQLENRNFQNSFFIKENESRSSSSCSNNNDNIYLSGANFWSDDFSKPPKREFLQIKCDNLSSCEEDEALFDGRFMPHLPQSSPKYPRVEAPSTQGLNVYGLDVKNSFEEMKETDQAHLDDDVFNICFNYLEPSSILRPRNDRKISKLNLYLNVKNKNEEHLSDKSRVRCRLEEHFKTFPNLSVPPKIDLACQDDDVDSLASEEGKITDEEGHHADDEEEDEEEENEVEITEGKEEEEEISLNRELSHEESSISSIEFSSEYESSTRSSSLSCQDPKDLGDDSVFEDQTDGCHCLYDQMNGPSENFYFKPILNDQGLPTCNCSSSERQFPHYLKFIFRESFYSSGEGSSNQDQKFPEDQINQIDNQKEYSLFGLNLVSSQSFNPSFNHFLTLNKGAFRAVGSRTQSVFNQETQPRLDYFFKPEPLSSIASLSYLNKSSCYWPMYQSKLINDCKFFVSNGDECNFLEELSNFNKNHFLQKYRIEAATPVSTQFSALQASFTTLSDQPIYSNAMNHGTTCHWSSLQWSEQNKKEKINIKKEESMGKVLQVFGKVDSESESEWICHPYNNLPLVSRLLCYKMPPGVINDGEESACESLEGFNFKTDSCIGDYHYDFIEDESEEEELDGEKKDLNSNSSSYKSLNEPSPTTTEYETATSSSPHIQRKPIFCFKNHEEEEDEEDLGSPITFEARPSVPEEDVESPNGKKHEGEEVVEMKKSVKEDHEGLDENTDASILNLVNKVLMAEDEEEYIPLVSIEEKLESCLKSSDEFFQDSCKTSIFNMDKWSSFGLYNELYGSSQRVWGFPNTPLTFITTCSLAYHNNSFQLESWNAHEMKKLW